jgi:Protein of unknown function (DUF2917)
MSTPAPAHSLPAQQIRMINASEGLRLEVLSGCLWLTRPGDAVDRFLVAGGHMVLHEKQVLIQSDRHPGLTGASATAAARYVLTPLASALAARPGPGRLRRYWQRLFTPPDRELHSCTWSN